MAVVISDLTTTFLQSRERKSLSKMIPEVFYKYCFISMLMRGFLDKSLYQIGWNVLRGLRKIESTGRTESTHAMLEKGRALWNQSTFFFFFFFTRKGMLN